MGLPLVKGRSYVQSETLTRNKADMPWYALHTRHQHESKVAAALEFKGITAFLPTYKVSRRWNDRIKLLAMPLFPGYVFATDIERRKLDILTTPGVASIVSVAGVPAEIPTTEIETIRRTIQCRANIEPHEYLKSGETVRVACGPLAGLEGVLVRKRDNVRLIVAINLLGRAAAVQIDIANLERVGQSSDHNLPC